MTRRADDLLVAGTLVISIVFFRCAAAVAATEYVRPPPGRVIFTEHTKPASHPQQVHVSLVGANHMRVSWITEDKHVKSVVEYGKVSGNYTASATGEHTSYRYFLYSSGKIHHVKIGPLDPGTVYYYRCGMAGDEFGLRTPPAALPVELAVAGDLGQTEWTASTLSHVRLRRAAGSRRHVVMLGSYADFNSSSEQYRWLARDLAAVDRGATPWVVVLLHAPWYNTNAAHEGEGEAMRKAMERLLYEARVDIVFAGHVHAYERFVSSILISAIARTTRVYNNKANPCGPVHITIGDGGNREGLAFDFRKNHKLAPLSLMREASFGHGRLSVVNATAARWTWHRNDDADSTVRDEIWLESLAANGACQQSSSAAAAADSQNDEL
uniref:Purple acid phosphatase n=1 Tax=Oryza barthii TaxID=65489 RepID=A0A0D3FVK7_9ORYZ